MSKQLEKYIAIMPLLKPLDSLENIVLDWNYRFGRDGQFASKRDEVVAFCAEAKDVYQAIQRACLSKRPNGKMHNHQSKVKYNDRMLFAQRIERDFAHLDDGCGIDTFDQLYDVLEHIKPRGIGPVTLYDVATRVGAFLELEPQSLYLHAGVRIGWALLHNARSSSDKRIARERWPLPLQALPADEVEDLLCCYRDHFKPWCAKGLTQ